MLNVIMLNVIMLNVIMLNVIKMSVIMLSVVAPTKLRLGHIHLQWMSVPFFIKTFCHIQTIDIFGLGVEIS